MIKEYVNTGRRKRAVASIRLRPNGSGKIDVNGKALNEFFPLKEQVEAVLAPFNGIAEQAAYDIIIRVKGGGVQGQAAACQLGLARTLVSENEERRSSLKNAGFLTRDSRRKERKKYGHKKARKSFQFSKR